MSFRVRNEDLSALSADRQATGRENLLMGFTFFLVSASSLPAVERTIRLIMMWYEDLSVVRQGNLMLIKNYIF